MARNVLLISLDTLRADVAYSGKFPTIERLRREGTWFRHAVSSSPLTPPSHATVLTGLQPEHHGIRHLLREQLRPRVPTLATYLSKSLHATTAGIVASPGLNRWYGLQRDFTHYDDEVPRLADGRNPVDVADVKIRGTALKRAPVVVERTLQWLRRRKPERFFLFVHFFDAHWPYEAPEQFGSVDNPYEGEVAYMDHYLGVLLDEMESMGYPLDDTLVTCFSDHGEDLAGWYPDDHSGERGHPEENGHGCLLFDTTQLVPLIVRAPGVVPASREIDAQVRLVDVTPTVLDLMRVEASGLDGVSLMPLIAEGQGEHRHAYSEAFYPEELAQADPTFADLRPLKAVRIDDRYKVIWEVGGERTDIYDLQADPLEQHPMSTAQRSVSGASLLHK